MANEDFGGELRAFLQGLIGDRGHIPTTAERASAPNGSTGPSPSSSYNDYMTVYPEGKVAGIFNQAARLKPGNLLVTYPPKNQCFQVDPESGTIEILFSLRQDNGPFFWRAVSDSLGHIYCTISGERTPSLPISEAVFGVWGAVVKVNHREAWVQTLIEGKDNGIVDPCGIELNGNDLIIADFHQQNAPLGTVYTIDKDTGSKKDLITQGTLNDPCSAFIDDDGTIWVANGLGDSDGDVFAFNAEGGVRTVFPRRGQGDGCVVGVCRSNVMDEVIVSLVDWPMMITSRILRVNKKSGKCKTIDAASEKEPVFFTSNGVVTGDIFWYGESIVHKKIFGYDLSKNKIVKEIDFAAVMGEYRGVETSYDMIEAISAIPEDLAI